MGRPAARRSERQIDIGFLGGKLARIGATLCEAAKVAGREREALHRVAHIVPVRPLRKLMAVAGHLIDCERVRLSATGPAKNRSSRYAAGSGTAHIVEAH